MKTSKTEMSATLLSLIEKHYVLDDAALAEFATVTASTADSLTGLRQAYMRVLLAGAQMALGLAKPQEHSVRSYRVLSDEDRAEQLRKLNEVHTHYYAVIAAAIVTPDIADSARLGDAERTRRALERNRRTNYARTAKSTLRSYVRASYSLCDLNVLTITKPQVAQLTAQRRSARPEVAVAEIPVRMEAHVQQVVDDARELAVLDPSRTTELIHSAMTQLSTIALELGLKPASRLGIGAREHRPVKLKEGMFWPVDPVDVDMGRPTMQ